MVEWSNTLRSGRSPHLRAQVRILQGAPLLPRVPRRCVKPPWLSWQSARLLTDRSLVRAQVEASLLASDIGQAIPVCQLVISDQHLHWTVFHLLTCLELYEGVKKFHPNLSERAGFGGAPGLTACRVANLTSTAIERSKLESHNYRTRGLCGSGPAIRGFGAKPGVGGPSPPGA